MSILDDLGLNFSKSPEDKKIEETKKIIRDSEEKRSALLKALKDEEAKINESSDEVYKKMGSYIYSRVDDLKASGLYNDQMEVFVKILNENQGKIDELTNKRETINAHYAEEIEILESSISRQKDCSNCNTKNPATASFCGNCGTKL